MAKAPFKVTMTGDKELRRLFLQLPERVQKSGLRKAMNAAANPTVRLAKGKVRRRTGLLRKALGKKVKTYKSGTVVAIVGARRNIVGEYKGKKQVPANYSHLVEKIDPYLKPAFESSKDESARLAAEKLKESVLMEATKLGKR